jgi:hypothetical protein
LNQEAHFQTNLILKKKIMKKISILKKYKSTKDSDKKYGDQI